MCVCGYCFAIKRVRQPGEVLICHTQSVTDIETDKLP